MALMYTPKVDLQFTAPDFTLSGIDGKEYSLSSLRGPNGILIVFMCNHCPYVRAIVRKLATDAKKIMSLGIGVVGINSNDATTYPDDAFENMKPFAEEFGITFPYLRDEEQTTAHDYDAVCTPDFFGFNKDLKLCYRGRFDDSGKNEREDTNRELLLAMTEIAKTGAYIGEQYPSMGCSIKWK